ncbi:MAG: hypothetical protein K0S49_791 [Microbacterium sp.]|jgi:hypothetical protein|nr:hypothetical protein [Microbacterium sp.]
MELRAEVEGPAVVGRRRMPVWRAGLGLLVTVLGLLAVALPVRVATALARDYRSGLCDGDDLFGNTCHITDAKAFGAVVVFVALPVVAGMVIAHPRRLWIYLSGVAVVALGVYTYFLSGGDIPLW